MQNLILKNENKFIIFILIFISVLPEFFVSYFFKNIINFSVNTGIAFGFLKNMPLFVIILSIFAFIIIFYIIFSFKLNFKTRIFLAIMTGGALANLIERIFFGGVYDWIKLPFFDVKLNIADIEIAVGSFCAFISFMVNDN